MYNPVNGCLSPVFLLIHADSAEEEWVEEGGADENDLTIQKLSDTLFAMRFDLEHPFIIGTLNQRADSKARGGLACLFCLIP